MEDLMEAPMILRVALIVTMIAALLTPLLGVAGDTPEEIDDQVMESTTGYILERAPDNSFIQVGDRNYRVGKVEVLAEEGNPQSVGREEIQEDDIVRVIPGAKGVDSFWYAEKVIIYRGELREEIVQGLGQGAVRETADGTKKNNLDTTDKTPSSTKEHRQNKIIFENGVWHN